MNCNPTLTAEEFKTVHNTLCELRHMTLRNTVDINEIKEIVAKFERGLESAYKQDDQAFTRKNDHYHAIKSEEKLRAIWSLYKIEDLDAVHPYPADSIVVYSQHWGDKPVHCAVQGATWRDIYRAADNCIRLSGDDHHVFIESFDLKNGNELHMSTGS
jgi:hypothetical protein